MEDDGAFGHGEFSQWGAGGGEEVAEFEFARGDGGDFADCGGGFGGGG